MQERREVQRANTLPHLSRRIHAQLSEAQCAAVDFCAVVVEELEVMRRCRSCKLHNIPKDAPKSQFWCSAGCKVALLVRKAKPKSLTRPKAKKKKPKSIARLVDDAAVLLQKLVRMKAAMPWAGGMCRCVTCGAMDHWTILQGGHFIERGRKAVKLLEENCHPQCGGCNCFRMKTASGVLTYREYMVSMYGEQFVQDLIVKSKQTKKYTRAEVEGIIFDFTRQIQEQEARLAGRAIPNQEGRAA